MLTIAELDVGQLIKDPYFTLFESVGALEVGYTIPIELECLANTSRLWTARWTAATLNLERLCKMITISVKRCFRRRLLESLINFFVKRYRLRVAPVREPRLNLPRWRGTKAIRSRRQYLPVYTLIDCYRVLLSVWIKHTLTGVRAAQMMNPSPSKFLELTVLVLSRHVGMSIIGSSLNITMR